MFRDLSTLMSSPFRIKALAYILKRPDQEGTAAEFGAAVGVSREVALRELNALVRLGIVRTVGTTRDKKFVPNQTDFLYEPIRTLLVESTTPSSKEIINAFKGVRGLWLLVSSGALVDDPRSEVDLLVVCRNPEEAKIARAVKKIETLSAIPVRYAVMEVDEYLGRRQAYDRILRDIFEYSHEMILERGG